MFKQATIKNELFKYLLKMKFMTFLDFKTQIIKHNPFT